MQTRVGRTVVAKDVDRLQVASPAQVFDPVGRCIYCGAGREVNLTKEHIIPYGLCGHLILPESSCHVCSAKTSEDERRCLRDMMGPIRARLGMQSRRKRKTDYETVRILPDGSRETVWIPVGELPRCCAGFKFPGPGIIRGARPSGVWEGVTAVIRCAQDDMKALVPSPGMQVHMAKLDPFAFGRMLAKMAHAFLVGELGIDGFASGLGPLILRERPEVPYLVGGDEGLPPIELPEGTLHDIRPGIAQIGADHYWYVTIRLFAFMNLPRYVVIVGHASARPVRKPAGTF